jgi:hypothetical protein
MLTQLLLVSRLFAATFPQTPGAFWISEKADTRLWRDVRTAFRQELLPQDPAKTAPRIALGYSYVARIGCVSGVCLVIIGARETATRSAFDDDIFNAFSYDLVSHNMIRIANRGFVGWKFVKWAYLAPRTPEVVFRFQTCSECEAEYLLSSFFFDSASRTWTIRNWTKNDILIGSTWTAGEEFDSITECLFRIADFSSDGNADIAVWCRVSFEDSSRKKEESVRLYTLVDGQPTTRTPDAVQARALKRALCKAETSHEFCRSGQQPQR